MFVNVSRCVRSGNNFQAGEIYPLRGKVRLLLMFCRSFAEETAGIAPLRTLRARD